MNLLGKLAKSPRLFNGISWGVTALVVAVLLGFTFWKIIPQQVSAAPEPTPTRLKKECPHPFPLRQVWMPVQQAIVRHIVLKTDISSSTNYNVIEYTVAPGDAVFSIAKEHNIKPETLLWANYDTLQDSPESIRVGQSFEYPTHGWRLLQVAGGGYPGFDCQKF